MAPATIPEAIATPKIGPITGSDDIDCTTSANVVAILLKNSTVSKYIESRGNSLHHIALEVDNIKNAILYLKAKNINIIYDSPQKGADNKLITFIHPKETPGLLIELCQNN